MKILDGAHPFFRPLWRRVVITAICLVWAVVELSRGSPGWAAIFGAMGALCIYEFFIVRRSDDDR
ncbi:hypothetical protein [Palleronia sp. LCG004]|uniref:hypothetical protein n=1 Tax=Palleronia sp. LCG004 TaxID=3079304 RepID=UPI002943A676|nr:hypothetical protein [Palleronia sp. LCG004]WOI55240.1 hypothetical protein RVY76_09250 [Palleronia sp. LCG004]